MLKRLGVLPITVMFAVILTSATASAATLCVAPGGAGGCFATIQLAIAAAASGDTINVAAGTYTILTNTQLIINKSITLQADPAALSRPVIKTDYVGWTNCAVQIAADNIVVQGFEIDNGAGINRLTGYIVGDYGGAKNGWTIRNNDIHNGRNTIRPIGNNVTIEYNNLHETNGDLINCEYGACFGLKVKGNWLHSHHGDMGSKPAGLTYNVSSGSGADVEITYNYAWANRTFIDFQTNGGLAPANRIVVAHNTVDYWIGDLMDPVAGENAEQMSIAWWGGSSTNLWNAPNFEIRDNLFTRQRWYAVVDTDTQSFMQGQVVLQKNLFWKWYLRDGWYPLNAYPNEWPAARGAVGWPSPYLGLGNGFLVDGSVTDDPLYANIGTSPETFYALTCGSPALNEATDGTNIGAWQVALQCDSTPPVTTPALGGTSGDNGWYKSAVQVALTAEDEAGGSGVKEIHYSLDGGTDTVVAGSTASVALSTDGTTVVSYYAVDTAGNEELPRTVPVKIDRTLPHVSCGDADGTWHSADVTITCGATDGTSGLADLADASFSLTTSVTAGTETPSASTGSRNVCDVAGNCAPAGPVGGNKIDKKGPTIAGHANETAVATSAAGALVTYTSPAASDGGSGTAATAACAPASGTTFAITTTLVTCTATDAVGNSASSSFKVIVNRCQAFGNEVSGMIAALIVDVDKINEKKIPEKKLIHELDKALKEVGQCDQKNACKRMDKFIKDVRKKKLDKHFDFGEEANLLQQAYDIKLKLGCS